MAKKAIKEQRAKAVPMVYLLEDLQEVLRLGRTSIYQRLRKGLIPEPIDDAPGKAQKRWSKVDIDAWVEAGMPPAASWKRMKAAQRRKRA